MGELSDYSSPINTTWRGYPDYRNDNHLQVPNSDKLKLHLQNIHMEN